MSPDEPATPGDDRARGGPWTRRSFLAGSGLAAAGVLGGAGVACSPGGGQDRAKRSGTTDRAAVTRDAAGIAVADLASEDQMFGWIEEVVRHGIRRPGYPANVWVERWIQQQFTDLGLEDVHTEPVTMSGIPGADVADRPPLRRWESGTSSLEVTTATGEIRKLDHFPVPYAAPVDHLDLELVAYDAEHPDAVAGKVSLHAVQRTTIPATLMATAGSAPKDLSRRIVDDADRSLANGKHTVPFAIGVDPGAAAAEAKAAAFIGSLSGSPGDTYQYYFPYTGVETPVPGVWIGERDGTWLRDQLEAGPVHVRLTVETTVSDITTVNVIGDLPGADDEVVIIGSHHDGPWASAVEDGSGIAMVLAQAHYWARQPRSARPHRLRFILQGGHMTGGAGLVAYVEAHRHELDNVVLEVHLEHAALEVDEGPGGELVTSERCVPRWFFTSRHAPLEHAVFNALDGERLTRSMLCAPDAFGDRPPTDGQAYEVAGVPIAQFLAAPWYLVDSIDTLDKIDRANLVPITRAAIRIIDFTGTTSAAKLRAEPPSA